MISKTDNFGRVMKDKDGLQPYRSLRGTSNLESLHQYLTTSFGHTIAGPKYSDSLLVILRHKYNSLIATTETDIENIKKNPNLTYLKERQQSPLPFLPLIGTKTMYL